VAALAEARPAALNWTTVDLILCGSFKQMIEANVMTGSQSWRLKPSSANSASAVNFEEEEKRPPVR
jgi:hypothetical protein